MVGGSRANFSSLYGQKEETIYPSHHQNDSWVNRKETGDDQPVLENYSRISIFLEESGGVQGRIFSSFIDSWMNRQETGDDSPVPKNIPGFQFFFFSNEQHRELENSFTLQSTHGKSSNCGDHVLR